jgi:hypothetical protein
MELFKDKRTYYSLTLTIFLGILTFFTFDFSGLIKKIFVLLSINTIKYNELPQYDDLLMLFDLILKVLIIFQMFTLWLFFNISIWKSDSFQKKYSSSKIVSYFEKIKEVNSLRIFGYSLSFIEDLRFYINSNKYSNLKIEIYIPNISFIENNFEEDKPIATRIETLKGRIHEWKRLSENDRIKELIVYYTNSIPIEYGVIINDKVAFISNYKWELKNDKLHLNKQPRTERDLFKISVKNKTLWPIFFSNLVLKEAYKP